MPSVQQTVDLNAPPERVWAFITALRYLPLWLAGVTEVRVIFLPETQPGTRFEVVRAGQRDVEQWLVMDWEPSRHLRLTEYRRDEQLRFWLTPGNLGTELRGEAAWPGTRGLLDRFLPQPQRKHMLARSLGQLQQLIRFNRDIRLLHGMGDE